MALNQTACLGQSSAGTSRSITVVIKNPICAISREVLILFHLVYRPSYIKQFFCVLVLYQLCVFKTSAVSLYSSVGFLSPPQLVKSARDLKYRDYFDPVDDPEEVTGERKDRKDDQSEGEEDEMGSEDESVEQYVISLDTVLLF